jgi:hypothetical protein
MEGRRCPTRSAVGATPASTCVSGEERESTRQRPFRNDGLSTAQADPQAPFPAMQADGRAGSGRRSRDLPAPGSAGFRYKACAVTARHGARSPRRRDRWFRRSWLCEHCLNTSPRGAGRQSCGEGSFDRSHPIALPLGLGSSCPYRGREKHAPLSTLLKEQSSAMLARPRTWI